MTKIGRLSRVYERALFSLFLPRVKLRGLRQLIVVKIWVKIFEPEPNIFSYDLV